MTADTMKAQARRVWGACQAGDSRERLPWAQARARFPRCQRDTQGQGSTCSRGGRPGVLPAGAKEPPPASPGQTHCVAQRCSLTLSGLSTSSSGLCIVQEAEPGEGGPRQQRQAGLVLLPKQLLAQ